jgi:negative regulator of replication initiation
MDEKLKEALNVLVQAVNIAQQTGGIKKLETAVAVKQVLDDLSKNEITQERFNECLVTLSNTAAEAYKTNCYSLRDAHYIYVATTSVDEYIRAQQQVQPQVQPVPESIQVQEGGERVEEDKTVEKEKTKKKK